MKSRGSQRGSLPIAAFVYNFPEVSGDADGQSTRLVEKEEIEYMRVLEQRVAESGALVVRPHTGQVYQFANARMEVLSSLDDTCFAPCKGNEISLVLRVFIEGQSILFCADAYFKASRLEERYGNYLKSDILQVTHHGFNGGSNEGYSLVAPKVCLVPVSEELFYGYMGYYRDENKLLIYGLDVQEILTGSHGDVVLTLPYEPKPNGRTLLLETAKEWQKRLGARSWIFADLTWETSRFSFLNATCFEGTVYANLYFEDKADNIRAIKITVPGYTVKRVDFADENDIDGNALYFNRTALAKMGIPEGKTFSVHFLSDRPIVIWGEKEPVYTR